MLTNFGSVRVLVLTNQRLALHGFSAFTLMLDFTYIARTFEPINVVQTATTALDLAIADNNTNGHGHNDKHKYRKSNNKQTHIAQPLDYSLTNYRPCQFLGADIYYNVVTNLRLQM